MSIELYPSIAKIKRNGVYENLPGFVPETGAVATQQMIATSESSATAQYVHNKGEYFRLNDTLYQAIVKINVGDAIVVGTNCEVAVLGNDVTHIANSIAAYELGIATTVHNAGYYFMVGETLYIATADIQVGDSISTSTNCRKAIVGNELTGLRAGLTKALTLADNYAQGITSGSDLDNYLTTGNYKVSSSGLNILNAPVNEGGKVIVTNIANANNIMQYYITNGGVIYYRYHNASGWSAWSFLLNKAHLSTLAPINSPTFTGTPKAPTAAAGTVSAQIATTQFTMAAVNAIGKPFVINNNSRTILPDGTDFNALTDVGNWNVRNYTSATTMQNIPNLNPGCLCVITTASANNITQIYICTNKNIYVRFKDGTGWSPWDVFAKQSDTIRANEIDKSYYNYFSAIKSAMTYNLAFANAPAPLQLYNYRGNIQNVHPKVLYFPNKFGGHKFWMAYTPYPNSLDKYENPCIAYSDDGYTWTNIASNPLDDPQGDGYNSDTHLVYRSDTSTLECWYRYVYYYDSEHRREKLYRQTTTDGVTWSAKELVLDSQTNGAEHWLSPAVIFDGTNYNMWVVDTGVIKYYTASPDSITTWSLVRSYSTLSFVDSSTTFTPWHIDVVKESNRYIMLVMCMTSSTSRLFITTSQDNETYSSPYVVVGIAPKCWDSYIYRSCIVHDGTKYRIYYSANNSANIWGMAITESTTLENFNGVLV